MRIDLRYYCFSIHQRLENVLNKNTRTAVAYSYFTIGALLLIGLLIEIFVIPTNAQSLQARYSEYAGDAPSITAILIGIVFFGQGTLIAISLLLSRIAQGTLLSRSSVRRVSFLVYTLSGVGLMFGTLLIWLMFQNTLPPVVHIGIWVAILLATASALVVKALKGVLQMAIENKTELESVI